MKKWAFGKRKLILMRVVYKKSIYIVSILILKIDSCNSVDVNLICIDIYIIIGRRNCVGIVSFWCIIWKIEKSSKSTTHSIAKVAWPSNVDLHFLKIELSGNLNRPQVLKFGYNFLRVGFREKRYFKPRRFLSKRKLKGFNKFISFTIYNTETFSIITSIGQRMITFWYHRNL